MGRYVRPAPAASPPRVLVAEDVPFVAQSMAAILDRMGYRADVAADGMEALRLLSVGHYRVAFIDLELPGMCGTEVARRLRALESPEDRAWVVATTAHVSRGIREACLEAGMDAVTAKPVTPQTLKALLSGQPAGRLAAAEPSDAPDCNLLQAIAAGRRCPVEAVVGAFLKSLEEALQAFAQARREASRDAVRRAAHRIQSLAAMVGADRLSACAARLQAFPAAGSESDLGALGDALEGRCERLRAALAPEACVNPSSAS